MMQDRTTKIEACFQWNTSESRTERSQHVTDSPAAKEQIFYFELLLQLPFGTVF